MTDESNYAILLLFVGLLAYSIENDEPMAVPSETVEKIMRSMAANNQVPQLAIEEDENGHIKFGCVLVEGDTDAVE